jgi:glycosyltransferase involved in cell wall biosynthesis
MSITLQATTPLPGTRTLRPRDFAMKVSCLVNHFDYGPYVGEAIRSVLGQTRMPDEIILVDDGSNEPHLTQVREAAATSNRVRLIEKPNGGQLSCFDTGLSACTGDVVFFLDADDRWKPEYIAIVLRLLEGRPDIGFVVTNHEIFHADGGIRSQALPSRDLGYSVALCLAQGGAWVGGPTSCLAIRRSVLDQIFPVPNDKAWRICADEALVYGSSLAAVRKYFLGDLLVEYRVHDANAFFGKRDTPERAFQRRLEGRRLTEFLRNRFSLPISLVDILHHEFRTIERPTREEYKQYRRAVLSSNASLRKKLHLMTALFRAYHLTRARE